MPQYFMNFLQNFVNRSIIAAPILIIFMLIDVKSYGGYLVLISSIGLLLELFYNLYKAPNYKITKLLIAIFALIFLFYGSTKLYELLIYFSFGKLFILSIFAIDSAAYIFGNLIGGPKLVPKISPNKTISGALSGLFFGIIILYNTSISSCFKVFKPIVATLFISIAAILGDLIVSYFKRILKIKDSSNLLGPHGGLWDKFGSIFLPAICFGTLIHYEMQISVNHMTKFDVIDATKYRKRYNR